MNDFFKAFIEFISDILAALADFLGWTINVDDLLPTTEEETEATEATEAPEAP